MRTWEGFAEPRACAGSSFPLTDGCIISQAWGSLGTNKSLFGLEELVGKRGKKEEIKECLMGMKADPMENAGKCGHVEFFSLKFKF